MEGFEPIFDKNSRCLILGSFPSVVSRKNNFYYGNKQNRFWKIMEEYFSVSLNCVEEKKNFLLQNGIALWDIVKSCEVKGSSDSDIKNIVFADIGVLLQKCSNIKTIFCNGKLSFNLTKKYVEKNNITIDVIYLPSTSPANVKFSKQVWFLEFNKIFSL